MDFAKTPYVKLTEHNDWEGETWHFYIPLEGNEAALKVLQSKIAGLEDEYELDLEHPIALEDVNALLNHGNGDTSYMDAHNKLEGFLDLIKLESQGLYKGGIKSMMS